MHKKHIMSFVEVNFAILKLLSNFSRFLVFFWEFNHGLSFCSTLRASLLTSIKAMLSGCKKWHGRFVGDQAISGVAYKLPFARRVIE